MNVTSTVPSVMSFESDTIKFLESHHLFHGIPSNDLAIIFPFLGTEHFEPGDRITEEATPGDCIYVITRGSVAVTKRKPNGAGSTLLDRLSRGATFGEMGLLEGGERSASVTAVEDAETLVLTDQAFRDVFAFRPETYRMIMGNLACDLSRRLRAANARIAELAPASGRGK
ncbi:MAG: CRP-like cAMP-binding protein [Verrucomicrobiales bacterium]|jgi:CRP-like cAMP-binding protein